MKSGFFFRPLNRSDFDLLQRWLNKPHVVTWWREPLDRPGLEAKYGPRIDGIEPTHVFVFEQEQQPVGWIQWYRWSNYPEHARQLGAGPNSAGIDLTIGEPDLLGIGLGPRVIRQFVEEMVFVDPAIDAVICDPEQANLRSLGAFKKAGFDLTQTVQVRGENFLRCVARFERKDGLALRCPVG